MPAPVRPRLFVCLLALAALTGPPARAQGYGSALQFAGQIRVENQDAFNFGTGDFTIEFWFSKPLARVETLFTKRAVCGPASHWSVVADTVVTLGIRNTTPQFPFPVRGTTTVSGGAWHHVAAVRQGVTTRLYIDGILDAEADAPFVVNISNFAPVLFGTGPCDAPTIDPAVPFSGAADEVMIWSRARTPEEIREDRRGTRTGAEPGLLLYWKLDEGAGQVAGDRSPNSIAGQLGANPVPDAGDPDWIVSGIVAGESGPAAVGLSLGVPHPNPVGGTAAAVPFALDRPSDVRLSVVDVLGREVAVLAEGTWPAGTHAATLASGRLAPGVYLARLTAGGTGLSRVFTVVR